MALKKTLKRKNNYKVSNKKSVKKGGTLQLTNAASEADECVPEKLETGTNKQRATMRFKCTKYCISKPAACGGFDEFGEEQKMDPVCKKLGVCHATTRFIDIPNNIKELIKEMQKTLEELTGAYKSRETPESKAKKLEKKERYNKLLEELKKLENEYIKRSNTKSSKGLGIVTSKEFVCRQTLGNKLKDGFKKFEQLEGLCERGELPDFKTTERDIRLVVECADFYKDLLNRYGEILNEINKSKLQPGITGALQRFGSKLVSRETKAIRKLLINKSRRKSIKQRCQKMLESKY